jgi:hypothetical protein
VSRYDGKKARVRRVLVPWWSPVSTAYAWRASRPGQFYIIGDGLHFDDWSEAIAYATAEREERP